MARPPRIPNWLGWDQTTIYFITFCVEQRKSVLANERAWQICLATFQRLHQWNILAAISMPDHLHLLGAPLDRDASVAALSKWFKRWFNEAYWSGVGDCRASVSDAGGIGHVTRRVSRKRPTMAWRWQEGCFDRLLRSDESLSENGNISARIPSARTLCRSRTIGLTNWDCRACMKRPRDYRLFTETPYKPEYSAGAAAIAVDEQTEMFAQDSEL